MKFMDFSVSESVNKMRFPLLIITLFAFRNIQSINILILFIYAIEAFGSKNSKPTEVLLKVLVHDKMGLTILLLLKLYFSKLMLHHYNIYLQHIPIFSSFFQISFMQFM